MYNNECGTDGGDSTQGMGGITILNECGKGSSSAIKFARFEDHHVTQNEKTHLERLARCTCIKDLY